MKKVSIILPTYCPNEQVEGYLKDFIDSLNRTVKKDTYQFVVIEQGKQHFYPVDFTNSDNIYIHKDTPCGYARAVNMGLALADGEYLVITNNDLVLPPKWLETMLEDYEGGILSPLDDKWQNPEPKIYENAHWFSLVLMDRKTFSKVGYLDESLPYRFHDQDYSIRVKKAGFPVRRTGKVIVKHINMATYDAMGRPNEKSEEEEMLKRYNALTFDQWIKK